MSREPLLGANQSRVTVEGLFRAFALASGRAVATWSLQGGSVELQPFAPLSRDVRAALEADAEAVVGFLGEVSDASAGV